MSTGPREAGRRVCAVQAARPKSGALPQGGLTPPEDVQLKPGSPRGGSRAGDEGGQQTAGIRIRGGAAGPDHRAAGEIASFSSFGAPSLMGRAARRVKRPALRDLAAGAIHSPRGWQNGVPGRHRCRLGNMTAFVEKRQEKHFQGK